MRARSPSRIVQSIETFSRTLSTSSVSVVITLNSSVARAPSKAASSSTSPSYSRSPQASKSFPMTFLGMRRTLIAPFGGLPDDEGKNGTAASGEAT
jgi:hypothetical protein